MLNNLVMPEVECDLHPALPEHMPAKKTPNFGHSHTAYEHTIRG